jgi:hypothetical protein
MNTKSLITSLIYREISKFEEDIKTIDIEISEVKKQYLDFDNKHYKSILSNLLHQNKLSSLIGAKRMLENEIELHKSAFTEQMIADLDYVLEEYCTKPRTGRALLIIWARIDIVRFERSGLSDNDYKRDTAVIFKKIEEVSPFFHLDPLVTLPEQQHIIIKKLIHVLSAADTTRLGFLRAAEESALPKEAIKCIVDTISSLKILPRGQNSFDDMWAKEIFGDNVIQKPSK